MNPTYLTKFSKSILTGLFAGIVATLICLGYDVFYREGTRFPLSSIINVSSLIFFTNIVFVVIGVIYYGFLKTGKKGELFYIIAFVLLTIYFAFGAMSSHRSDDPLLNTEFHQLLLPIVIIMGAIAAFGIPFLFHYKKFEEYVL